MKTSKIKLVVEIKSHTNDYGETFYHNLEMENGDKINIGKKAKCSVGDELEYEITGSDQHEFRKAKKPFTQNAPSSNTPPSPEHLKGIKIGHAITNAVNLHCSIGRSTENENLKGSIKDYAKMIYQISEELNEEI